MSVDISALKKFQDVWGPVLDALPTVMDAVAKKSEIDNAVAREQKALDGILKAKEEAMDAGALEVEAAKEAVSDALKKKAEVDKEIEEAKRAATAAAKDAEQAANTRLDAINGKVASAEERLKGLNGEVAQRLAAAESEHKAKAKEFEREIKALETRKAAAQEALDAIRSKLG